MKTKKIVLLSLLSIWVFWASSFAYNFDFIHKKVESYLQKKVNTNPTYARYYQQIEKELNSYAKQIELGNKKVLKKYVSWLLSTKLISNIQKGKFKNLKARNYIERKVLQSAFDQWKYVTLWVKTNLSKTALEGKLRKYLWKFIIVSFDKNTYLIKLPKDNPFAKVFLELVQAGKVPQLDFLSTNIVLPKVLKRTWEASLWNMTKIEADKIQEQLDNSWKSVVIGVLDTGIDPNHQDLKNAIWHNRKEIAGNGIDDDGNGYVDDTWGWDFGDNDNDPAPGDAHGTHVAWTIAAQLNGVGVYGADSAAKVMAVKIFVWNNGYTDSYKFAEWVRYAVDNGAKVLNASLGWDGTDDMMNSAIDYAKSHNVIMVVAAWNENKDASNTYPCASKDTICVGATDQEDKKASFSNYGSKVDIAAPGVNILSTIPDNKYAYYNGTSMATPHVAAVVGIIKMYKPTATFDEVKDILKKDSLPGPSELGGAIVDAKKVYEDVAGVQEQPQTPTENENTDQPDTNSSTDQNSIQEPEKPANSDVSKPKVSLPSMPPGMKHSFDSIPHHIKDSEKKVLDKIKHKSEVIQKAKKMLNNVKSSSEVVNKIKDVVKQAEHRQDVAQDVKKAISRIHSKEDITNNVKKITNTVKKHQQTIKNTLNNFDSSSHLLNQAKEKINNLESNSEVKEKAKKLLQKAKSYFPF